MAKRPEEIRILPENGTEAIPPIVPSIPLAVPSQDAGNPRQTLSYIRNLLENNGLDPKNKLGQNFLIDLNMLDLVVRSAELSSEDSVLEVGTGTATLTNRLSEAAGAVFTVEIDYSFHQLAQKVIRKRDNIVSFRGDILERKNELNPAVLFGWNELTSQLKLSQRKLVANLPYAVATPVITNLLLTGIPIERMVVMVQWEIGERMRAEVGTKDYNSLSVLVQSVADVELVRKVSPSNFHPRPRVDSAIMLLKPNAEKRALVGDVKLFRAFLRDLYTHRRKNLRQALTGWPSGKRNKEQVDAILAELGIDGLSRSETLSIADHLRLCQAFADVHAE